MPLYRFQIHSHLTSEAVLERVGALMRERPGFRQLLKESFGGRPESGPPFIGKVVGNEFKCHRYILYRNSFLPRIRGHVHSSPNGSRIDVMMYLHPVVAVVMLLWLGAVGLGAAAALGQVKRGAAALVPIGLLVFGVVLTLTGFYPEAIKARRLLEQHIGPGCA
jgi:hypothetical protein